MITPPGSFPENGVLGLAPNKNKMSIVRRLKEQNIIDRELVTLNLEDQQQKIIFGQVSVDRIMLSNQELNDQVNFFSNVGQEKWAVLMDHVRYDGDLVRRVNNSGYAYYIHAKQAYIDSGNSSIQLPYTDFQYIKQRMQWNDTTIDVRRVPNTEESQQRFQLFSYSSCDEIEDNIGPLEFYI